VAGSRGASFGAHRCVRSHCVGCRSRRVWFGQLVPGARSTAFGLRFRPL